MDKPGVILAVLDRCCDAFTFPALDNGYCYLAASRLSLFKSEADWALVIETFGFAPRVGEPDLTIQTYASRLHARNRPEDYVSPAAHRQYLAHNPNHESRSASPVAELDWCDPEDLTLVRSGATEVSVRGRPIHIPDLGSYAQFGIELELSYCVQAFELCRYLAAVAREDVLATTEERRVSVLPAMKQILQLEAWHHPDVTGDERPSQSETFRQLAKVLATGDTALYRPTKPPNNHWRNWPEGGTL
jgi:hypothetical protein